MNWTRYDRLNKIEKIGWNIGSVRRWRKVTDLQMAKDLHIDIVTYRKIEKSVPEYVESLTIQQIYKIMKLLKVSSMEEILSL